MIDQDVLNSGTGWDRAHPDGIGFDDVSQHPFSDMVTPHQQLWWLYARVVKDQISVQAMADIPARVKEVEAAIKGMREGSLKDYYEGILAKWMHDNADDLMQNFATFVWPGINDDGYFTIKVPKGWADVRFFVEANAGNERYGRLAIAYDTPDTLPGEEVWWDDSDTVSTSKGKLLSGLRIGVFGDSLFSGVNTRPLSEWLADYGATTFNQSVNGATLAAKDRSGSGQTSHNSILEQTFNYKKGDLDIAIIDGFENDYEFADIDKIKFGTYLGTGNSAVTPDATTYCGAMETAIDNLYNKQVKILWVFPYRMSDEPGVLSWHGHTMEGKTLEDYRDVTLLMCGDYGVTPVRLDYLSLNGIYPWQKEAFFACDTNITNKSWDKDGVHPGAGAHEQFIMPAIIDAIRRVTGR